MLARARRRRPGPRTPVGNAILTTEMISATRVVFPERGQVALEPFEAGVPGPNQVEVRTVCSLVSTGTEGIVMHQLFSSNTRWADYGRLPFYPGYALVGIVERVGEAVRRPEVGRAVALRRGHASRHVVDADQCNVVPDGIAFDEAVWFAFASIAFRGAQAARIQLGDDVLVVGAGPIGQMMVRWARASGAGHITVVDPFAERLVHAQRGGASTVIAKGVADAKDEITAATETVPSIIVDTTGNARVFEALLRLAPRYGRVVLLGDTGRPEEQRLTHDVVLKGVTITGAHDGHDRDGWSGQRVTRLFFDLLQSGRFSVAGLVTHRYSPNDCRQAYELTADNRGLTMGVLFDWSTLTAR